MGVYIFLLGITIVALIFSYFMRNRNISKIFSFIIALLLFFVAAFRKVGTDYYTYYNYYNMIENAKYTGEGMEIGYFYLNKLISNFIGGNYSIFFITSLIIISIIYLSIIKNSINPLMSLFLFLCLGYYLTSFNILRQYIAMALVLYSLKYFNQKYKWIIFIIIASAFHTSVLVVIPFYIIAKKNLNKKHYICIGLIAILSYIFYGRTVAYIVNFTEKFSTYKDSIFLNQGANPIRVLINITILIFCFLAYESIKENKKMKFCLNMMMFGTIFSLLMIQGKIFARVVGYFSIFEIILIPYALMYSKSIFVKKYKIIVACYIALCLSFNFYYSVATNQGNVNPYKSYLNERSINEYR